MILYDINSLFIPHINSVSNIHKHKQTDLVKSIDEKQIFLVGLGKHLSVPENNYNLCR